MTLENATHMRSGWVACTVAVCLLLGLPSGCNRRQGPAPVIPPAINPDRAAAKAIAAYDSDDDGHLSKEELKPCPGLMASFSRYDADHDGAITASEIAQRIGQWQRTGKGLTMVACKVFLNSNPLGGAEVNLEPVDFLADHLKPAYCITKKDGWAGLSLPDEHFPDDLKKLHYKGMQIGVYNVRITHPEMQIPSEYNTKTQLGVEIGPRTPQIVFRLNPSS